MEKVKTYTLRFRAVNRDTFDFIRDRKKRIETRAATKKYTDIAKGDTIVFSCGKDKFSKKVAKVEKFRSVGAIYKKYNPSQINPAWKTEKDGRDAWTSFPDYNEKIKKYGLIALTLK